MTAAFRVIVSTFGILFAHATPYHYALQHPVHYRLAPGAWQGHQGCGLDGYKTQEFTADFRSINDDEYVLYGRMETNDRSRVLEHGTWGHTFAGNFKEHEYGTFRSAYTVDYRKVCISVGLKCIRPGSGYHCNLEMDSLAFGYYLALGESAAEFRDDYGPTVVSQTWNRTLAIQSCAMLFSVVMFGLILSMVVRGRRARDVAPPSTLLG